MLIHSRKTFVQAEHKHNLKFQKRRENVRGVNFKKRFCGKSARLAIVLHNKENLITFED
jgi:hypothetical protein